MRGPVLNVCTHVDKYERKVRILYFFCWKEADVLCPAGKVVLRAQGQSCSPEPVLTLPCEEGGKLVPGGLSCLCDSAQVTSNLTLRKVLPARCDLSLQAEKHLDVAMNLMDGSTASDVPGKGRSSQGPGH